jgi:hypothetical protein
LALDENTSTMMQARAIASTICSAHSLPGDTSRGATQHAMSCASRCDTTASAVSRSGWE